MTVIRVIAAGLVCLTLVGPFLWGLAFFGGFLTGGLLGVAVLAHEQASGRIS